MFESAEIEHDIDKTTFEEMLPQLRADILNAQFDLVEAQSFPTILLFSGMEGAGVVDTLTNAINARLAQTTEAAEVTGYKRYKITDEDWRNREKWDEYATAVCDMIDHTSTSAAPRTLVEANNKYHARVKVLKTICERLEESL